MNMSDLEEVSNAELISKMSVNSLTFKNNHYGGADNEENDDDDDIEEVDDDVEEVDDDKNMDNSNEVEGISDVDYISDDDDVIDIEYDDDGNLIETTDNVNANKNNKGSNPILSTGRKLLESVYNNPESEEENDEESDQDDDANYLQKFDNNIRNNFLEHFHPEKKIHNYEEVRSLSRVIKNENGLVTNDYLHKTLPFLTKYEMTRVLGQRAKQINSGAKPFVKVPENVIDGYLIAKMELENKKIPFILKRPLPDGSCEYWRVSDLELM